MASYLSPQDLVDRIGVTRTLLLSTPEDPKPSDVDDPAVQAALERVIVDASEVVEAYVTIPTPTPGIVLVWTAHIAVYLLASGDRCRLSEGEIKNYDATIEELKRCRGGEIPWKVDKGEVVELDPNRPSRARFVPGPRRMFTQHRMRRL